MKIKTFWVSRWSYEYTGWSGNTYKCKTDIIVTATKPQDRKTAQDDDIGVEALCVKDFKRLTGFIPCLSKPLQVRLIKVEEQT